MVWPSCSWSNGQTSDTEQSNTKVFVMAVEKPWSTLAWSFLSFLTQTGIDKASLGAPFLTYWLKHCTVN